MTTQHTPGPWKVFRVKDGANKGKIARRFGVSQKTVFNIKKGLVWGHVV